MLEGLIGQTDSLFKFFYLSNILKNIRESLSSNNNNTNNKKSNEIIAIKVYNVL
jgi:hypothetical protein